MVLRMVSYLAEKMADLKVYLMAVKKVV